MFLAPSPRYTATLKGAPSGNRGALFTVGIMRQLVNDWKTDPRILNLASSIVHFQPQQDWLSECRELFNYVQNSIRYQLDVLNVETLATPLVTIQRRAGDCDDKAALLATFFEAVGHPTRFIMGNYEGRGWDHVFLQVNLNGEWINADPCMEGPLGNIQPGAVEFWIEE